MQIYREKALFGPMNSTHVHKGKVRMNAMNTKTPLKVCDDVKETAHSVDSPWRLSIRAPPILETPRFAGSHPNRVKGSGRNIHAGGWS